MSKIRVHELAKELNKSSKDIIYALKGHGVIVESHMSTIGEDHADKIRKYFTAPPVKKQEAPKAAPAPAVAAAVEEAEEMDDTELVAVIAAAIAAAEGTTTDGFVVRSIKRRKSNKWNA